MLPCFDVRLTQSLLGKAVTGVRQIDDALMYVQHCPYWVKRQFLQRVGVRLTQLYKAKT